MRESQKLTVFNLSIETIDFPFFISYICHNKSVGMKMKHIKIKT